MPARQLVLLAPEMASRGGVQSFMWRIWEAMLGVPHGTLVMAVLNDSESALRVPGDVPETARVIGARASKVRFVWEMLRLPLSDVMIVGHVGQAPVAWVLKRLGRVRRYAVILHGFEAWRKVTLLQRLSCRAADSIVATTRFTAQRFADHNDVPATRVRVFPLCANEKLPLRSRLTLRGGFRILTVGRQRRSERYKGFAELIGALALLRDSGRDAILHIVGDGDDQPWLREHARQRDVAEHVVFHGILDDPDLEAAYASCDVYAMPSRDEGFGIVFLEAMQHAKPCVGASSGGIPDVIEEGVTGLLVPYADEAALAGALTRLHDQPALRTRMGLAGLHKVQTAFSQAAFRGRYRDLILELAQA